MKFPLITPLLSLFAFAAVSSAADAPPATSLIKVRVEQINKAEVSKDHFTKTQTHSLKVILENSSHEEAALKIKFAYFGHGIKDHNVYVVSEGEKDATVKPARTSEETTAPATAVSVAAHKKAPASGNVIIGYGVQVFQGDKLVAESYEPPSVKDQMGKAAPAAKK